MDTRILLHGHSCYSTGQLVELQADAVISHPILQRIARADFFRAVAGFDLSAALRDDGGLLFCGMLSSRPRVM